MKDGMLCMSKARAKPALCAFSHKMAVQTDMIRTLMFWDTPPLLVHLVDIQYSVCLIFLCPAAGWIFLAIRLLLNPAVTPLYLMHSYLCCARHIRHYRVCTEENPLSK